MSQSGLGGHRCLCSKLPRLLGFQADIGKRVDKVKSAIGDWFEWLETHEEQVLAKSKDFEVEVSEMPRVTYNPVKAGKPEPLFWSETPRTTRKDTLRTIRLMRYSREDLLKTVNGLSSNILNWKPTNEPAQ